MKKLLVVLFVALTLTLTACKSPKGYENSFTRNGKYSVKISETDIEFIAVLHDEYQEYTFIAPETVTGLKATSYDSVTFELDYKGMSISSNADAIKCATDFSAATELLEKAGTQVGNKIKAEAEGLTAFGTLNNGMLSYLIFTDCKDKREFIIKTEAAK